MPVNGNTQLSRWSPQQVKPTAPSKGGNSERTAPTGEEPVTGPTREAETLPPFPVLLRWLEFYHTMTGNWPQPELLEEASSAAAPDKPLLTLLPNPGAGLTGNRKQKQASLRKAGKKNQVGVINKEDKGAGQKDKTEEYLFEFAAAFNLKASVYYRTALDLIKKQAAFTPANPDSFAPYPQTRVTEETVMTLASFLAWCCLPATGSNTESDGQKAGMEMYLSLDRWSRLLKMRKATLGRCLKELAGAGLLEIADSGADINEMANPTRRGNRVYRLAVPLPEKLPALELPQNSDAGREPQENTGEPALPQFPALETETNPGPAVMSHANYKNFENIKNKKIKNKKHEHGEAVERGTGEIMAEKLLFLLETASFPGYASPEGLTTLAEREAQKFAADPRLDLTTIQRVYHQVLATWSAGRCTRNPIGLFHYSLTRVLKQPASSEGQTTEVHLPAPKVNSPGTAYSKNKNNGSQFQKPNLHKNKVVIPASTGRTAFTIPVDLLEEAPCPVTGSEPIEVYAGLDPEKIKGALQKQVIEALQGRFRQPDLAHTLARLEWSFSISENKLRLELQDRGSHILAAARWGQGELSIIKIALSQGLRALTGQSFEIEISLAAEAGF